MQFVGYVKFGKEEWCDDGIVLEDEFRNDESLSQDGDIWMQLVMLEDSYYGCSKVGI